MTLTIGTGPFGPNPAGSFNFPIDRPDHTVYFEDSPRRVRVRFNGETVADSCRMKLLHEFGVLPTYYFPRDDVRMERLTPTDHHTHCGLKGDASYWSITVGDRTAENAVWGYPEPLEGAPPLADYLAFYWDRVDAWYEEDEEIFVHPRDPYHRVDVLASSRHVTVRLDGQVLAESRRPRILYETGLPPRYYLPEEDVRTDLLVDSATVTRCPYKGKAEYRSVRVGGTLHEDLVWTYPQPLPEARAIAGLLCFWNEKVELAVEVE
jgi:uncharacterized protein (DUF427 family)